MQGSFEARDSITKEYLWLVKQVMSQFTKAKVVQVARGQNRHADSLATSASSITEDVPWIIKMELIAEPSINAAISVAMVSTSKPIIEFLAEDRVPNDKKEANRVRRVAAWYWLSADCKLYRRSFGGPYLLCLRLEKVNELLADLHDGVCNSHESSNSVKYIMNV